MFRLRIVTLNVQGLANPETRRQLFYLLRVWPVDVCCLQEVHAPADASFWTQEWGRPAAWTEHTAILFRTHLGGTPKFDVHMDGHVLISTFRCQGRDIKIANMYLPSRHPDRLRFLDTLITDFASTLSSFDFLVGDWNMFPDPALDRVSAVSSPITPWSSLQLCLISFFDAALAGAAERYHTFHATTIHGPYQARLDHVFAHHRHLGLTVDTRVESVACTDQSAVFVSFSETPVSTPLLPHLNTSILSSPRYQNTALDLFAPYTSPPHWDVTKVIGHSHAQDHSLVASRQRTSALQALQRQFAQARNTAACRSDDPTCAAAVTTARDRLDAFITTATERAALRCRTNWLEQGETPSFYFFSRFSTRADTSLTSLLRDTQGSPFPSLDTRRQHIATHFRRVYSAPSFDVSACSAFLDPLPIPSLSPSALASLLAPFSISELETTLQQLHSRKAPGPDGLPYELYQTFSDSLVPILLPLFCKVQPLLLPSLRHSSRSYLSLTETYRRSLTGAQSPSATAMLRSTRRCSPPFSRT